jgi:hypothetical protein
VLIHTKKVILTVILLILSLVFIPQKALAQQTESICYSQCAAYKFIWQGTVCYDVFADNCTDDSSSTIKKTIKFLKDIYSTVKDGSGVSTVFKAWFVCKPLIENCIVPHLSQCQETCQADKYVYAPDLSVGHPSGSFHGVYYDEASQQLYFKLVNYGLGYAWDIDVEASSGHTPNRDGKIQGGQQLFKEKVEHLIYLGARLGPPKSFGDIVSDFLINESLNGQYLRGFKKWLLEDELSDSKNYNVPSYWIKAVPFTPVANELNRVIFNADGNKLIPERSELNNTYIFEIDLRPTPARFNIESFSQELVADSLNSFEVKFNLKNTGEEGGLASVKIYEGKYQAGKSSIYETEQEISGGAGEDFETTILVELANETNPYCGKNKQYTLVVFDEEGNSAEHSFALPIYLGSVNGRVEDLFGKPVVGATVKAASGQETTTNKFGNYHLKGLLSLGTITVTASKREFSKPAVKSVKLEFVNEFQACNAGNLNLYNVDFVLMDEDVFFTVTIKDKLGNPVNAHVLAVNPDFRKEADINGSGPMSDLQPGQYTFIVSAPGYKTLRQDVNAVPSDTKLEFVLDKLNGRPNDTGLRIIAPRLLWEKTLGTGNLEIGNLIGTKNGELVVASVANNRNKTRQLFFLNLLTGNQIRAVDVPWSVEEQRYIGLDASYDGGTVGLTITQGAGLNKQDNLLKLFNAVGDEIGTTTLDRKLAVSMDVSPDGFYVCPYLLLDKGLHKYTGYEIEGKGDDNFIRNPATCDDYFLRNNHLITNCKEGLCEETLAHELVKVIGDISSMTAATKLDASINDAVIVARTYKQLYYYGQTSWDKELDSSSRFKSVAVSVGGEYALTTVGSGSSLEVKVYDQAGVDQTPEFPYEHVNYVLANDKGLFFVSTVANEIKFYQIGEYDTDYHPEEVPPTVSEEWTSGLSSLGWAQRFYPVGYERYADLDIGVIYRADRDLKLKLIKPFSQIVLGTLSITKDTIFSVNNQHDPVLLKGQMTADFGSPVTIYAIKFDRFWLSLFQTKLNDFIHNLLPENEYFIVQNVHTKFIVKNEANTFNVAVKTGEVKVKGINIDHKVRSGRQISINRKNKVRESAYLGNSGYLLLIGAILLAVAFYLKQHRSKAKNKK